MITNNFYYFKSEDVKKIGKSSVACEQSFKFWSNNKTVCLETSKENEQTLVEIRMFDTRGIKNTPSDQWWQIFHKK